MPGDQDTEKVDVAWYVRDVGPSYSRQLWCITKTTATRMGVSNPENGPGSFYEAEPGETIWSAIDRMTGWMSGLEAPGPFCPMVLGPGQYYPRMARPYALATKQTSWLPELASEQHYLTGAQNQFDALINLLQAICRVVQPSPSTLHVYGHEIRNLLILASTEVEMHWRGVLTANGVFKATETRNYVSLAKPLKLTDYRIRFRGYPQMDEIAPFADWTAACPSKSIPWYAAYNGVKHNREFEFEKATLENAFNAVAACAAMLVAQFGDAALTGDVRRFMEIDGPDWELREMYLMPEAAAGWRQEKHLALR